MKKIIVGLMILVMVLAIITCYIVINKKEAKVDSTEIENRIKDYEFLLFEDEDITKFNGNIYSSLINKLELNKNNIVKYSDLNNAIKEYFGSIFNIEMPIEIYDNICDIPLYIKNNETNDYEYNDEHSAHGLGGFNEYHIEKFYFVNSAINGDEYTFDYKLLLNSPYTEDFYIIENKEINSIVDYENNLDKMNTIRFTFIKENDKYIMKNVEIL